MPHRSITATMQTWRERTLRDDNKLFESSFNTFLQIEEKEES